MADDSDITAEWFLLPDILNPTDDLAGWTFDRSWQSVLNDCGFGSVSLLKDAPFGITQHSVIGFSYRGTRAFNMLYLDAEQVVRAPEEETGPAEKNVLSGPGLEAIFGWARIYPAGGVERQPIQEQRAMNWTEVQYDDSGWAAITVILAMSAAQASWGTVGNNHPWDPNFPDGTASILWSADGDDTEAIPGDIYIRQSATTVTAGLHRLYVGADNRAEVYVDGLLVMVVDGVTEETAPWIHMTSIDISLPTGAHVVAAKVTNYAFDPANINTTPETGNPAGFAWALYEVDAVGTVGSLIDHSDSSAVVEDFPAGPPGMSAGQAMGILLDEAQTRGWMTTLTWSFDDVLDTDGATWPITPNIAARVGSDLLTWFKELADSGYIDFWLSKTTLELNAVIGGTRGAATGIDFEVPTDLDDPSSGNLTALILHGTS